MPTTNNTPLSQATIHHHRKRHSDSSRSDPSPFFSLTAKRTSSTPSHQLPSPTSSSLSSPSSSLSSSSSSSQWMMIGCSSLSLPHNNPYCYVTTSPPPSHLIFSLSPQFFLPRFPLFFFLFFLFFNPFFFSSASLFSSTQKVSPTTAAPSSFFPLFDIIGFLPIDKLENFFDAVLQLFFRQRGVGCRFFPSSPVSSTSFLLLVFFVFVHCCCKCCATTTAVVVVAVFVVVIVIFVIVFVVVIVIVVALVMTRANIATGYPQRAV